MKWMNMGVAALLALAFTTHEARATHYYCRSNACYVSAPAPSYRTVSSTSNGADGSSAHGTGSYCHDPYCKEHDCPPPKVPIVVAYRQCKVIYFDACSSAWYEADALVVAEYATPGVLVHDAKVPRVGCVKAWIKEVYAEPHLLPPK